MATGFCRLYHACGRLFRRARAGIFLLWLTGSLCLLLAATVSVGVVDVTETYVLTPEAAVAQADEQSFDCILVLGAGLRDDGSPSHMLYDRVLTAVELYGALSDGTADSADSAESPASATPLVMSGDHTGDYNEPAVMKQTAVDLGVPSEVIFLDHEGYSTYESIWRVREIFGAERVLIVTQEYHLYRALYIARTLGLDAYGVSADKRAYRKQTYREVREMLARYKDFFAAARGDYDGEPDSPVDLNGNGNLT